MGYRYLLPGEPDTCECRLKWIAPGGPNPHSGGPCPEPAVVVVHGRRMCPDHAKLDGRPCSVRGAKGRYCRYLAYIREGDGWVCQDHSAAWVAHRTAHPAPAAPVVLVAPPGPPKKEPAVIPPGRRVCEAQVATGRPCQRLAAHEEDGRWVCGTHSCAAIKRREAQHDPNDKKPSGAYWRAEARKAPTAPARAGLRLILSCPVCGGTGTVTTEHGKEHCECRMRAITIVTEYEQKVADLEEELQVSVDEAIDQLRATFFPGEPRARRYSEEDLGKLTDEASDQQDEEHERRWREWRSTVDDQEYNRIEGQYRQAVEQAKRRDRELRAFSRKVRALQRKYEPTD